MFSALNAFPAATNLITFSNGVVVRFQTDGNFVAYYNGTAVAATGSVCTGNNLTLAYSVTGNFVVMDDNVVKWSSGTANGASGASLVIQDHSPYMQIVDKSGFVYWTASEDL